MSTTREPEQLILSPVHQSLKEKVRVLKMLLDDPHPGLWSWNNSVARMVKEIGDLYGDHL